MERILSIFERIPDPRQPWKIKHNLAEILLICILGVLANASSSYEIHIFAQHGYALDEVIRQYAQTINEL